MNRLPSHEGSFLQQHEKVAKLIEWFVKAAQRHAVAMETLAEDVAAAEVQNLNRFYLALRREQGMETFLLLLEHPDPDVAGMAAVYAMREAPERCRAKLAALAVLPGLIGFRAKAALERWDNGEW